MSNDEVEGIGYCVIPVDPSSAYCGTRHSTQDPKPQDHEQHRPSKPKLPQDLYNNDAGDNNTGKPETPPSVSGTGRILDIYI